MGSLGSETQILYFPNNYYKLVLKNYTKRLQPDFPQFLRIRKSVGKNLVYKFSENHEDI